MRTPARTLQATWLAMLAIQSIGSIDAQRKLPSPKQYVAIATLWGILFLMADTGAARLAARLSMLVLLTGTVIGPFGKRFIGFLNTVSKSFAVAPPATTDAGGTGPPPASRTPISPRRTA